MFKKIFAVKTQTLSIDLALFLIRLAMGYAFIHHGWGKIQNPLHWMGPDATMPSILQALAAISEFGGGIALIVGLLTRLFAFGLVCTMAVATYTHAVILGDPMINPTGGRAFELPFIYLLVSLLILAINAGRFSLDQKLFGSKR